MEYKLIQAPYTILDTSGKALVEEVNEAINEGWRPVGGVAVFNMVLMQAMVRD